MASAKFFQAVGRRKEAVARVRVLEGNGAITVNGQPIDEVYPGAVYQKLYNRPFELTKTVGKYAATVKVSGGGRNAQLEAIVHGLSRTLSRVNVDNRAALKKSGLLTRDPRAKERIKYGLAHAARAKKNSPKR